MEAKRQRLIQRRGWDRAAAHYDRYWATQLQPAQELLLSKAGLQYGEQVIDVACGTGLVTLAAAAAVSGDHGPAGKGNGGRVTATDLSPAMVAEVEARAGLAGLTNVTGVACGAEDLTAVAGGPYDVALCALGLMYVPEPDRALAEMYRVLRPGGRIVVSVWGQRRHCGWADLFGIVDSRVAGDVCPLFFSLGAPGILAARLNRAGFVDTGDRRLSVDLDYGDGGEALGAAFLGGPVALAYARFDERQRAEAEREYLDSLHRYRSASGRYRVPGQFVVAWARRPGDRPGSSHVSSRSDEPADPIDSHKQGAEQ